MKKIIIFVVALIILASGFLIGFSIKEMINTHKVINDSMPSLNNISDIQDNINETKEKINSINDSINKNVENYNNMMNSIDNNSSSNNTNTNTNTTTDTNTKTNNDSNTNTNTITTNEDTKSNIEYSASDKEVIDTLSDTLDNIKNSEVTESFKSSAKKTFIDIVDFIFYGGTIKGYTFDELTDNGKAKVLEISNKIDEAIEAKVPNYKDTIASKATKAFAEASKLIKKGSTNLNDFMKSKLSEESYNAIIDSKDDLVYYSKNAVSLIKDNAPKIFNTVKDKLSSWYARYKNS